MSHCIVLQGNTAVKQILLALNEKRSIIIEDLDDSHMAIKVDEEFWVWKQLDIEVCCTIISPWNISS